MNTKDFFKQLNILYFSLLAGQVMFVVITFLFNVIMNMTIGADHILFTVIVPIYAFIAFLAGNFIFKKKLEEIAGKPLNNRMETYKTAFLIRLALMESVSFFTLVIYLISGNLIYLAFALLIIILYSLLRPSKEKITDELGCTKEEKKELLG